MQTLAPDTLAQPQAEGTGRTAAITADLCILGGGPAGIELAIQASAAGFKAVLVEKHKMGGTSLNYGSIPVTALMASAERAQAFRTAAAFGIGAFEPVVDRAAIAQQIATILEQSAPNAAAERLAGLGVKVLQAPGRFLDPKTLMAGETRVIARRFVIATGSAPVLPQIAGLANVPYSTPDTIFQIKGGIDHLIVLGGGATGVELAQAHRRLGARVTIVDQGQVLQRFDPELAGVVKARLNAEGVVLLEDTKVNRVEALHDRLRLDVMTGPARSRIEGSHLLVACGRQPVVADIGLEAAKVKFTEQGIKTNASLRTSNRRIYALGDVTGLPFSTQRSEYHASLLAETLLTGRSVKVNPRLVAVSVNTDPEIATVGLSEAEARQTFSSIQVLRLPFRDNARALANRAAVGHVKVVAEKSGRIVGAGIVSRSAGDLIAVWSLAIANGLTLADMRQAVAPFPSLSGISRQVAMQQGGGEPGKPKQRRWVHFLPKFG